MNMGVVLSEKHKYDLAIQCYMKSADIICKLYGTENAELASIYGNVGVCYDKKDDPNESLQFYLKSLELLLLHSPEKPTIQMAKLYEKISYIYGKK